MIPSRKINIGGFRFLLLLLTGCLDPYSPPIIEENLNALVVDGFINATTRTVTVNLSRTLPIYASTEYVPESSAIVVLEEEGASPLPLDEVRAGTYEQQDLTLNYSKKYRLYIRTEDEEYRSEYITLRESPPIDEIKWETDEDGLNFYVSTHDPSNQTQYYQWTFTESWQYTADYFSVYKFENDSALYRDADEHTYVCFKDNSSSKILIKSTTGLSESVVRDFPVHVIPKGSSKIGIRYSILVQQRSIDVDTYNFLNELQKTTETLGGLFDPLPSQVMGNLYNVGNPSTPVLGYFTGGVVKEKRIFIDRRELPSYLLQSNEQPLNCGIDTVAVADLHFFYPQHQLLEGDPPSPNIEPYEHKFFLIVDQHCTDCRLKDNGTTTKPDFWQ